MKKQLVIIEIVAILVCAGLSGCDNKTVTPISGNPFEGSWVGEKTANFKGVDIIITELTFTNSTVYMSYNDIGFPTETVPGTFETQCNKLLLKIQMYYSFSFTYSVNGNKLTLDDSVFTKQ